MQSAGSHKPNFKDPVIRDTVNIGGLGDHVAIRFQVSLRSIHQDLSNPLARSQTNNPGPWFLHCHIDFHLNNGFAVVFAEDSKETAATNPVPRKHLPFQIGRTTLIVECRTAAWNELCPTFYDDLLP